jgi:uncharacterized protein YggT (Ycf19 family)
MLLIMVWAFGSFFPRWQYEKWYRVLNDIVWPYISLFRGLNLRMGQFDFTPMVAILVLAVLQRLVLAAAVGN